MDMNLSREGHMVYLGTLNAIVKLIEDEKLTAKKLRHMLLSEIDNLKHKIEEK